MLRRTDKSKCLPLAGLAGVWVWLLAALPVLCQTPPPVAPAQFDPSEVYFQGYLATRSSEQLDAAGDFIGAMEKLGKAQQLFGAVQRYYPEWKPEMVKVRSEKTDEAIKVLKDKSEAQIRKNRNQVAELEGGVKKSGQVVDPARDVVPLTPGILEVDPLAARRLKEAEQEVKRLQNLANQSQGERSRDASRLEDVRKQRDVLAADLRATKSNLEDLRARLAAAPLEKDLKALNQQIESLEQDRSQRNSLQEDLRIAQNNVEALRSRLAAAPLEKDLKALNQRIETLEQEREAMGMALSQSRGSHTEALARIATLEADLKVAKQKHTDLDRDLKTERKITNSVVAGQRRQLDALEKELANKNTELTKANEQIKGLVNELQQSRDAFAQLRTERDSLLLERDQMSALLKLNEGGRIQDLIEQNMSLAKSLREANERLDRLNRESNADKDLLNVAKRDLAMAKSQINGLHQDRQEQEKRIEELKAQLKNEEAELAKGKPDADPAEVATLREIIKNQLRVQERRRQARDLLVEAVKEMGTKDERLKKAIELFDGQEIALTPEEQKLVAGNEVDGEFVSPYARNRVAVGNATADLNRDIAVFERTAEKSFLAGRLLPTRELYQMIIEQNPGHTPSLCKLGVVLLKLDEPSQAVDTFRRAVELDESNPYAYRMLGFALMKMGDLPAAEKAVRHAVDLAPNDAKSQMLQGNLCYQLGRSGEAESFFKAAINADPVPSEPYFNLALICARDKRFDPAKTYYQQALERGALPDSALEETLDKH